MKAFSKGDGHDISHGPDPPSSHDMMGSPSIPIFFNIVPDGSRIDPGSNAQISKKRQLVSPESLGQLSSNGHSFAQIALQPPTDHKQTSTHCLSNGGVLIAWISMEYPWIIIDIYELFMHNPKIYSWTISG